MQIFPSYCVIGQSGPKETYIDQRLLWVFAAYFASQGYLLRVPGGMLNWGYTSKLLYMRSRCAVFSSGLWHNISKGNEREKERAASIVNPKTMVWVPGVSATPVDMLVPRIGGMLTEHVHCASPATITRELLPQAIIKRMTRPDTPAAHASLYAGEPEFNRCVSAARCAAYAAVGELPPQPAVYGIAAHEPTNVQIMAPEVLILNEPVRPLGVKSVSGSHAEHKHKDYRRLMLNVAMYYGIPVLRVWKEESKWLSPPTRELAETANTIKNHLATQHLKKPIQ